MSYLADLELAESSSATKGHCRRQEQLYVADVKHHLRTQNRMARRVDAGYDQVLGRHCSSVGLLRRTSLAPMDFSCQIAPYAMGIVANRAQSWGTIVSLVAGRCSPQSFSDGEEW
jgi:hypothetical protein